MNDLNPFAASDLERRAIWEMLVRRDFTAFLAHDWARMQPDFWTEGFCGLDARKSCDPNQWTISFPTVEGYRDEWLRQAEQFRTVEFAGFDKLDFLFSSCRLDRIEFHGERALAHKKFNGSAESVSGDRIELCFQSLFSLIRIADRWLIAGFVGYLPNPMESHT